MLQQLSNKLITVLICHLMVRSDGLQSYKLKSFRDPSRDKYTFTNAASSKSGSVRASRNQKGHDPRGTQRYQYMQTCTCTPSSLRLGILCVLEIRDLDHDGTLDIETQIINLKKTVAPPLQLRRHPHRARRPPANNL